MTRGRGVLTGTVASGGQGCTASRLYPPPSTPTMDFPWTGHLPGPSWGGTWSGPLAPPARSGTSEMLVVPLQLPVSQLGGRIPTWQVASPVTASFCSMGCPPEQVDAHPPSKLPRDLGSAPGSEGPAGAGFLSYRWTVLFRGAKYLPGDYVGGIYLNELIYKTERDRRRKQIYGYQRGKGGGIN